MIRWRIGTDTPVPVTLISEHRITMLAQAFLRAFDRKLRSPLGARIL